MNVNWDRDVPAGQPLRLVRPYALTQGRTAPRGTHLPFEALLVRTGLPPAAELRYEAAEIVRLCERPVALAEVAAALDVPIGAARVLVGDLVVEGLLVVDRGVDDGRPGPVLLHRVLAELERL